MTLRDIPDADFTFLGALEELEVLQLGDCTTCGAQVRVEHSFSSSIR